MPYITVGKPKTKAKISSIVAIRFVSIQFLFHIKDLYRKIFLFKIGRLSLLVLALIGLSSDSRPYGRPTYVRNVPLLT